MSKGFSQVPHKALNRLGLCVFKNSLVLPLMAVVFRQTYGFHRLSFNVDVEQFLKSFQGSRATFFRAISELKRRNIIRVEKTPKYDRNSKRTIFINENVDFWIVDKTVYNSGDKCVYPMNKVLITAFQKSHGRDFSPYIQDIDTNTIIIKDSIQKQILEVSKKLKIT